MTAKIMILALLSGFWLLNIFNGAPEDFSYYDSLFIAALYVSALTTQAALAWLCRRMIGKTAANVALALFLVANFFTFYLVFYMPFAEIAVYLQALIIGGGVWAAYHLWFLLDTETKAKKIALSAATVLFGYAGIIFFGELQTPATTSPPIKQDMTSSPDVRIVEFAQKPNVYFLSFDALIPRSLAKQNLGINDLPYHDYMEQADFRIFRNLFADTFATRRSFAHFLSFGTDYYNDKTNNQFFGGFFTGLTPTPMFEIFKANGYTTNTYYLTNYFGPGGPHVDNHHINSPFAVCFFLSERAFRFGFWGYCPLSARLVENNWGGITSHIFETAFPNYIQSLKQHFLRALSAQSHSLFFAYFTIPQHAPTDYRNQPEQLIKYRQSFKDLSALTVDTMEELMAFIQQHDPTALIFIFGDHGTFMSDFFQWKTLTEEEKRFFVLDHLGVLGGVYPKDACAEYFDKPISESYATLAQIGRQIILCLSAGQDPLISPVRYQINAGINLYGDETPEYFEDYIYE